MTTDAAPKTIELTAEPPFQIGSLEVRPATLEVLADGKRELLEPRVMQVLVALARRRGEMVSRDDLIEQCWGGRVVGEDAITRCLARLRKLAHAHETFEIETLPRVGVRLVERAESKAAHGRPSRVRWAVAAVAAAVMLAAGLATWVWRHTLTVDSREDPRIAVAEFQALGNDPAERALAARLADQVEGVLGENAAGLTVRAADAATADLTLGGTVVREAASWRVRAFLEDVRSGMTLWSETFQRPVAEESALLDEVAVALTDVAFRANDSQAQPGLQLDPRTVALHIAASRGVSNPASANASATSRATEQVVARAPDFAAARATLALDLAIAARYAPPAERASLLRRARAEAERAIRTHPPAGALGYDALHNLARFESPNDLAAAEDLVLKGIAAAPDVAILHMRECRFLFEVGRGREALRYCERARALRPLTPPIDYAYADALYAAGDLPRAADAAERSVRFHPTHLQSLRLQLELAAFHGDPERARALVRGWPGAGLPPLQARALERLLDARKSGAPGDADRAVAALWDASRGGVDHRYLVLGAASLGRLDDAFRALEVFGAAPPPQFVGLCCGLLLEPVAAPLWRDPRFWPIAAKAGYVRYWRTRGKWPDFCSDPAYGVDCRKEAARVAGP
jgi:DNA-binding winged helix-turn-helix (wHTH) protein/tetratricopeptide (TPR) repeat protein